MTAKHLTDRFVDNVEFKRFKIATRGPNKGQKVEVKQNYYFDRIERGLALVFCVGQAGTKSFSVMTYRRGKPRSRHLGIYPDWSLAKARDEARRYRKDPAKFEREAETGTFGDIAKKYLKRHVEAKKLRSKREIERQFNKYLLPRWKDTPFLEVKRRDVNDLLDHIEDKSGPPMADAVLATIRKMFNWYAAQGDDYVSPLVKGMGRNEAEARDRVLSDDEIRAMWTACDGLGAFGALAQLCLLTAQRRSKVGSMRRDEIDEGVWTIGKEAREKGTAGSIKLPQMVLDIIKKQPEIKGNPHVFPGRGKVAFNAWSDGMEELRKKLPKDMPHWQLHDLRRTARSLMAKADVRPDIAERVLGHKIKGVEGVYDRHDYAEPKKKALESLANTIKMILNPPKANVVRFRRKK